MLSKVGLARAQSVVAAQQVGYPNFVLSRVPGDCHGGYLNGEWAYVGQTKDGRGYYQRWYAAGMYWVSIYYDTDCGQGGTGKPEWLINKQAPSTSADVDLDGDGACN